MHSLIDGILASSRSRGFASPCTWSPEERRDLEASALACRKQGIIPIIAEIKPKAVGRALSPAEVAAYAEAGIGTSGCLLVGVRYRF